MIDAISKPARSKIKYIFITHSHGHFHMAILQSFLPAHSFIFFCSPKNESAYINTGAPRNNLSRVSHH